MTTSTRVLRVGTRKSPLARWQAAVVIGALSPVATCEEVLITTEGERAPDVPLPEIGGEGVGRRATEQERPSRGRVAGGDARRDTDRRHVMRRKGRQIRAKVAGQYVGVCE